MSMPTAESGLLYVVESDFMSALHKAPIKFPKVAGIILPGGSQHFVHPEFNDGYELDEVEPFEGKIEQSILAGAASFIDRYMSTKTGGSFNCHAFSDWIVNGPNPQTQINAVIHPHDANWPDRDLVSGEKVYIFANGGEHSAIALGKIGLADSQVLYLQVFDNRGNMGILPHDSMVSIYGGEPKIEG